MGASGTSPATIETMIAVKIVIAGDAGTMVTKAKLTAGNTEGDVMWGVDNTFLSPALQQPIAFGADVVPQLRALGT